MPDQLKQAIAHIKAGDRKAGKAILLALLREDQTNGRAWLYLSAVVNTPEQKRKCLQTAVQYDPANHTAQKALAELNQKYPSPPTPQPAYAPLEDEEDDDDEMWLPDSFKSAPEVVVKAPVPPPAISGTAVPDTPLPQNRWDDMIVRGLAAYHRPQEIAARMAQTGIDYNQAATYVLYVSQRKKRQIALRRMPIVLIVAAMTFLGGFFLLGSIYQFAFGWPMVISSIVGTGIALKDIFAKSES